MITINYFSLCFVYFVVVFLSVVAYNNIKCIYKIIKNKEKFNGWMVYHIIITVVCILFVYDLSSLGTVGKL